MKTLSARTSCLAALTAALVLAAGRPALALQGPAPGAVNAQTLKLPDGPASVRGLAAAPAVGIFTGQLSQTVPIELPPGPNGFGPKLDITYSGELGYGVVGVGWALSELKIVRSLRHGVPTYSDADELELIGLGQNGRLVPDGDDPDLFWVEGALHSVRVERSGEHFLVIDPTGTRYLLGGSSETRQEQDGKTAAWYVEFVDNVAGQQINYHYANTEGQLYLERIEWGPLVAPNTTMFVADLEYEARPDVVVSFGAGFAQKTSSRLKRISARGFGGLARSYALSYEDSVTDPELAFSRLVSIEQFGTDGVTAMPRLSFTYATAAQPEVIAYDADGWVLNERGVSVADVDGDGMADLLRLEAGNHQFKKAHDTVYSETRFLSGAEDIDLETGTLIDLDGDARAELVRVVDDTWRAYRMEGTAWRSVGEVAGTRALPLRGARMALADLNGDGRSDVVRPGTSGILVSFARENGYEEARSLGPISSVDIGVEPGKPDVRFADVNGDGLDDVVWLAPEWMKIFLGRGDGTFQAFNRPPYPWNGPALDVSDILLGDLNRDGLLDLVRAEAGHVTFYRGDAEGRASNVHFRRLERPEGTAADAVVTLADLNGNGSLDVIWSSPAGLWALDFASGTSASMLTGVDNGLGMTTLIDYTPSAELAVAAERAGDAWNVLLPVTVPVPTRVETRFADGTPTRVVEYDVRDGFWDGSERRFGGFLVSRASEIGDSDETTLVEETFYHRGLGDERSLRGRAWFEQKMTGAGSLLMAARSEWQALPEGENPEIRKAALVEARTFEYEGVAEPIETRTSYEYDAEVRPIVERYEGRLDTSGDERIVRRRYVSDDALWVRDKVCSETVLEGDDETVRSDKVMRYGAAEIFDVCTRAGPGWLRQVHARVRFGNEDRWVMQESTDYDGYGNAVNTYRDGVWRQFTFDSFGLFPVSETVYASQYSILTWEATWNETLGLPRTLTDPNGEPTTLAYDPLGRLLSVRQGNANPHVRYAYDWAAPQPKTTTFTCDRRLADCGASPGAGWREVINVTNGASEPLYTATLLGTRYIIEDYTQYDARGQEASLAEPFYANSAEVSGPTASFLHATTSSYDALSRLTRQELPNGATKLVAYRAFGQTVSSSERSDVTSTLDGLSRIVRTERVTNDIVESVRASYDASDRLLSMLVEATPLESGSSPSAAEHRFAYDTLGRLREAEDPDTGLRLLVYNDRNFLIRHENAAGQIVHFDFDDAGRLLRQGEGEGFDDENDQLFSYDDPTLAIDASCRVRGRLARVRGPFGEVKYCYDAFGRETGFSRTVSPSGVPSRTASESRVLAASGLLLHVSHDDGLEFDQQYDGAGRLVSIGDFWRVENDGDIDAAGRILRERYGNGVEQSYSYNPLGLVDFITVNSGATSLYLASIQRNAYGAPTAVSDYDAVGLDHQASFTYDGASRLTDSTLGRYPNQYQFSYRYDGLQNMVERGATGPRTLGVLTGSYRYGEPGLGSGPRQLTSIVPPGGSGSALTFAYDAAGRQVRDRDSVLAYNGFDQLVRVEPPPATIDPESVGIVDLGSPSSGYSQARDINASGTVLAWDAANASPYPGLFPTTAFTYDDEEGFAPLPQPASANFPMAINDHGDVTGLGGPTEGEYYIPYRYREGAFQFFTWNGVAFTGIGYSINNAGAVTGWGYFPDYLGRTDTQWFRTNADGTTEPMAGLADPTAFGGGGLDINDEGEIVGFTSTSAGRIATLYTDAQGFQDLNLLLPPGGSWLLGTGNAINAAFIAGDGVHDGKKRAYRYDRATGELIDVGIFEWSRGSWTNPDQAYVWAADVNRYGDVAGSIYDPEAYWPLFAYLYTDAVGLVDLSTLVGPEWTLQSATGINDHGEISGIGTLDGQRRAYKLTLAIPRGAGGNVSGAIDYTYGHDGFRTSSVSGGDATYWFSPTVEEHAGRREHYIRVGDRLVAHVTMEEQAGGSAAPPAFGRFRTPVLVALFGALLAVFFLLARRLRGASIARFRLPGMAGLSRSGALATIAISAGGLCSCEHVETSRSLSAPLWTQVERLYLHQGVSAGPALITSATGAVTEERRYEPFGEPVDALRNGVPAPSANLELEPHNSLNKPTDPRTGFSYHGARWMAPGTARWLSPDPAVKAPNGKFMGEPWELHPYQYVGQNPVSFWDPDGFEKKVLVITGDPTVTHPVKIAGQNWRYKNATPAQQSQYQSSVAKAASGKIGGGEMTTAPVTNARGFSKATSGADKDTETVVWAGHAAGDPWPSSAGSRHQSITLEQFGEGVMQLPKVKDVYLMGCYTNGSLYGSDQFAPRLQKFFQQKGRNITVHGIGEEGKLTVKGGWKKGKDPKSKGEIEIQSVELEGDIEKANSNPIKESIF